MMRRVKIQSNQKITQADFENFGAFPRETFDALVLDLGGFPATRYSGFAVEQTGVSDLRVSAGRLYKPDGSVYLYDAEGGATVDLLDNLPAVAKRIATVVVYGNAISTDLEPRTFLVDASTGKTEGREVATEDRRQAYVDRVLGQESSSPEPGAVSSDYVAVAHVTLTPAGIESIEQIGANRVTSIRGLAERVTAHDARFAEVGPQLDTLKTDVSALAVGLGRKAERNLVASGLRDIARLKDRAGLPDDYVAYGADRFLVSDESEIDHPDFDALVSEGVRFPRAASQTSPLALENDLESRVVVTDGLALPSYREETRLAVEGRDGEYALTSTTVETVTMKRRFETRTRRVYHSSEVVCTNSNWWRSGLYDDRGGIFRRAGETFEVENAVRQHGDDGTGNIFVRVRRYSEETVTEAYWDRVVEEETVSGSILSQTFLNSQDGWLTGLDLFFTKVAASGPVRVVICETRDGEPDLSAVLSKTTLQPSDLSVMPEATAVSFKPVFTAKGSRLAVVLISAGAHFVATVRDNKFAQGTLFYSTDGAYVQGDLFTDLAFRTRYAVFDAPIVTVGLAPVELAGGIDKIDINADAVIPEGTRIEFQARIGGSWFTLSPEFDGIFDARPSLAQFRMRMIGTTDVMPALGMGAARSALTVSRPGTSFVHVSEARTMPAPVNSAEVRIRLEGWSGADHIADVSLLTGGAFDAAVSPAAVVDEPDPEDGSAIVRVATFTFGAAVSAYKVRLDGATASDASCFHVAERTDLGFAT